MADRKKQSFTGVVSVFIQGPNGALGLEGVSRKLPSLAKCTTFILFERTSMVIYDYRTASIARCSNKGSDIQDLWKTLNSPAFAKVKIHGESVLIELYDTNKAPTHRLYLAYTEPNGVPVQHICPVRKTMMSNTPGACDFVMVYPLKSS